MKVGEIKEKLQIFKEEVNILIQVKIPGPKAGIQFFPIKELKNKDGYIVLVAREQGGKYALD